MMNTQRLVIGIDGGGSQTVACLARVEPEHREQQPEVLGRALSGPCNPQTVGFHTALSVLDNTISTVFADAQLERQSVAAACLALAGTGRAGETKRVRDWAETAHIARRLTVVHDAEPLLAAGTPDGVGVALVAGTGSFAYGRHASGQTYRAGGYGHLFGDEGSGYWIARQALGHVARALDGRGPATQLTQAICRQLGISKTDPLVPTIYQDWSSPTRLASLAEAVVDCAAAGDRLAEALVSQAGSELAELVITVGQNLAVSQQPIPLALAGSLLLHATPLQQTLIKRLESSGLDFTPISRVEDPVLGALRLATQNI
ncbi:MAG: BadF/BadG/BcrA/BcrD ATPase family protein [Planctomycetaceae bacterium]